MGQTVSGIVTSVGDLFYPTNPKLRKRAQELGFDVNNLIDEFEQQKGDFESLEATLQVSIGDFLNSQGYDSFQDLDAKVREVVDSDVLGEWEALQDTIDVTNTIDHAIATISGIVMAAGVVTIGGLVIAGLMTGPAGWAALGGLGLAVTVVALITTVAAVVIGKVMQEKLKDTIEDLFHARADAQLQVNRLGVLNDFMTHILVYISMTEDEQLENYERMFTRVQLLAADRWEISEVNQYLREKDQRRGSWTKADPNPRAKEFSQLIQSFWKPTLWKGSYASLPLDDGKTMVMSAVSSASSHISFNTLTANGFAPGLKAGFGPALKVLGG